MSPMVNCKCLLLILWWVLGFAKIWRVLGIVWGWDAVVVGWVGEISRLRNEPVLFKGQVARKNDIGLIYVECYAN